MIVWRIEISGIDKVIVSYFNSGKEISAFEVSPKSLDFEIFSAEGNYASTTSVSHGDVDTTTPNAF